MMDALAALPGISNIHVRPSTVDEWYGIEVTFDWSEPLPAPPDDEAQVDRAGVAMRNHVAGLVLRSPEYRAFYSRDHLVSVDENGSDTTQRRRYIPEFREVGDFCDWGFTRLGGWIGASERE